ncbi:hypothetical protein [Marisediminicola senii]|uniref:hypothetical protein n=1 Tax=Marisediminicola senii TaxID=2711233 RepID=UPI0013ED9A1D|nr:hypothetical protein [Marisediminicola senii]
MQLGTRWGVGAEAPSQLPPTVIAAIRGVETDISDIDTSAWRWTLTWLEGRPVVELDDGTVIRYDSVTDSARVIGADATDDAE